MATCRPRNFKWFDSVLIELNDVVFQRYLEDEKSKDFREKMYGIMNCTLWALYEKGFISFEECRHELPGLCGIPVSESENITQTLNSWVPVNHWVTCLQRIKQDHKVYAVGNMTKEVFNKIQLSLGSCELFDKVFLSSELSERLPHSAVFTKIFAQEDLDARRMLYIGGHIDNVIAARAAGLYAINSDADSIERVNSLCADPVEKAWAFLKRNAGRLDLETTFGMTVKDAYLQYHIVDITGDKSLIYYDPDIRLFSWHYGSAPSGLDDFPPDLDCNALACSALDHVEDVSKHAIMDQMLNFTDSEGILQGYLSHCKVRVDVLMCVNGLALFNEFGRGHEVKVTEDWVYKVVCNRAYQNGTHYYVSPDFFLYSVSRLLVKAPSLRARFQPVLKDCILERSQADGDALSLACRVVTAARCGVPDKQNLDRLLFLQREDGSWQRGLIYRWNRKSAHGFHQGLTVSLAILACEEFERLRS